MGKPETLELNCAICGVLVTVEGEIVRETCELATRHGLPVACPRCALRELASMRTLYKGATTRCERLEVDRSAIAFERDRLLRIVRDAIGVLTRITGLASQGGQ